MRVCDDAWSEPLSAWLDEELEPAELARVEAHLARCRTCAATVETYRALGAAMRAEPDEAVPERMIERARGLKASSGAGKRWLWAAAGSAALAAAALLTFGRPAPAGLDDALADELVAHHLRGFARAEPCEIDSDDPAVVRGWVEERLGYAVEVPKPEGVELMGARACTIGGQATAALMYRNQGAPMTLFVPPPGSEAVASAERFGSGGSRCVQGPIGERICVSARDPQPAFAVGDLSEAEMLPLVVR